MGTRLLFSLPVWRASPPLDPTCFRWGDFSPVAPTP